MECDDAAQRLPWMVNGTIDAAERARLEEHLSGCAACRQELDETRRAASVFGAHLPTSALIDLAWERPNTLDSALVNRHPFHGSVTHSWGPTPDVTVRATRDGAKARTSSRTTITAT